MASSRMRSSATLESVLFSEYKDKLAHFLAKLSEEFLIAFLEMCAPYRQIHIRRFNRNDQI